MNTADLDVRDYKFIVKDPVNFSPQRNKAIMDETLTESKKYFDDIRAALNDPFMERLDVMSSYAMHRFGQGTKTLRQFVGESNYKTLVGEKLLERVRIAKSVNKLNNNKKFKDFVLL